MPLLLIVALSGAATVRADDSRWTITPGLGHDQFEQTFFLDTTGAPPESAQAIKQTLEDLKETYGSLEAAFENSTLRFSNTVYASGPVWRDIANARVRLKHGGWSADLRGRLEWRGDDNEDTLLSAYTYLRLDAIPRLRLGDRWSLLSRADWEMTDYRKRRLLAYDNHRTRIRLGCEFHGDRLESIETTVGVAQRAVPDSSRLSYTEWLLAADALGWTFGPSRWGGSFSYAERGFDAGGEDRDHQRWRATVQSSIDLTSRWMLTLDLEWELWNYRVEDEITYDIHDGRLRPKIQFAPHDALTLALVTESRWERALAWAFASNDYTEYSIGPSLEWTPGAGLWFVGTPTRGHRNYASGSLAYDDYSFWRFEVYGDATVIGGLAASFSATYETEDHDDPLRDADYLYFSFALRRAVRL